MRFEIRSTVSLAACFNFDFQFHNECQTIAAARFYSNALAAYEFHKRRDTIEHVLTLALSE